MALPPPSVHSRVQVHTDRRPHRAEPQTHRYEAAYLTPDGDIRNITVSAQPGPLLDEACAVIARGSIVSTDEGPCAVEDLLPGDLVRTIDGQLALLRWIGSTEILPASGDDFEESQPPVCRITADVFGPYRPQPDLLLGGRARMVFNRPGGGGPEKALAPVRALVDQSTVLAIRPFAEVRMYQIAFDQHQAFVVNGLGVESFHPGAVRSGYVDLETERALAALMPCFGGLDTFGPLVLPRLTGFEVQSGTAA